MPSVNNTNSSLLNLIDTGQIGSILDYYYYRRTVHIIFVLLVFVALVGNFLILLLFCRCSHLRTTSNSFLISLSAADFVTSMSYIGRLIAMLVAPRATFRTASVWCVLVRAAPRLGIVASAWSILALTLDHYFSIQYPLRYTKTTSKKFAIIFISFLWIMSLILAMSPMFGGDTLDHSSRARMCDGFYVYTLAVQLLVLFLGFLFPCLFVIVLYTMIVRIANRQAVAMAACEVYETCGAIATNGRSRNSAKVMTKAMLVYLVMCIVFLCGWLPFIVVQSLFMLCRDCDWMTLGYISSTAGCIALSSCAVNPWLHTMRKRIFKQALKSMCCPCKNKQKQATVVPVRELKRSIRNDILSVVTNK